MNVMDSQGVRDRRMSDRVAVISFGAVLDMASWNQNVIGILTAQEDVDAWSDMSKPRASKHPEPKA